VGFILAGEIVKTLLRNSSWEGLDPCLETYLNVASSFSRGVNCIWTAEDASVGLLCAMTEFRTSGRPSGEGAAAGVLHHLARIPSNSMESLAYVTDVSYLMCATRLFDTFLSETTQFLFLMVPRAIGDTQPVPLRALFEASSRNEAITLAASARALEISHLPVVARIQFLREAFELDFAIPSDDLEGMVHIAHIGRCVLPDHRDSFHLRLDDRGEVVGKEKMSSPFPTKISRDNVRWAIDSYERSARSIAEAVFTQVLKQSDHPAVQHLLKGSTSMLEVV